MSQAFDPGALNLRMQVMEPVATDDEMGGGTITYIQRRSVWAAFEEDGPARQSTDPVNDALATGTVRTRIALAPPVGWRLQWIALGGLRAVEVVAVQRGTSADPFDLCRVLERAREAAP
jgi:head-tail adaptor